MKTVDRFLNYVKIDTQSDPHSTETPSTSKQLVLAKILLKELTELGLDAYCKNGYVMATLNKNIDYSVPTIGFIAHLDTSSEESGENVTPRIIKNYSGSDIVLNKNISISSFDFPYLKKYIGHDLVVTDGNTLLGADDKAGIAAIMGMLEYIISKNIPHGDIKIAFTPDEEIGRGTEHFDVKEFNADFAYTVDGGFLGEINYENFNAATCEITITGKGIHPGSAKNKMVNAILLAMEFQNMLPQFLNPAYTDNYDGFNHITEIFGSVTCTNMQYIIRNHDEILFKQQKDSFFKIANYINEKYNYKAVKIKMTDTYYNMKNNIRNHMEIIDLVLKAMNELKIVPSFLPIRGGTDGAMLSYKGLPCPNLGTGGLNFHSKYELLSIDELEKNVILLATIVKINAQ